MNEQQREHRKSAAAERAEQARIDRAVIAERNRIVAWLRKEADAYGFYINDREYRRATTERVAALELADAIEQGEHEQSHDDEVTRT